MGRDEILTTLKEHWEEIQRLGVRSLRLFGSAARDEALPRSDVDLLVDFGKPTGFDQYMDLLFRLEELIGAKVDLVTTRGLREELRADVERDAIQVA